MQDHLSELNERQREAVLHTKGPLLIVAGAGAGKTKTITHRIINLIKQGVSPDRILAVTFTNKAAKEMKDRIFSQIEKSTKGQSTLPFISTFHSLGVYIIKENARLLGLTKYFTILDEGDSVSLVKEAIKEINLDIKEYEPKRIKGIISREKGNFANPTVLKEKGDYISKIAGEVWEIYEKKKAKENALDFDDLLVKTVKLLKEKPEIRELYQEKWEYVHIDEYQDTNEAQYLLSKLLSEKHKNICVVGDSDQCVMKGTKIKITEKISLPIENIKKGDYILSNYGGGRIHPAKVINIKTSRFSGELIKIETAKGKILTTTPSHIHFAGYKLGQTPQIYLNYLMYKKGTGWRIGTTSIHTKGQRISVVGFKQRSNQEHADATWVIATHQTEQKARIQEYIFSLKYQIPTLPFTPRKGKSGNGYVNDKLALSRVFSSFNTEESAKKLLLDLGLSREYPHHQPQTHNSNRRNINITLCSDKRGSNPMHLISMSGNDKNGKEKLIAMGLSVRPTRKGAKKNWRFETVFADYGKSCLLAIKIASIFPESSLVFKARLGGRKINPKDTNSLPMLPASSLMPGMSIFIKDGYDCILKVSKIPVKNETVYDLNIERTHNFIANDIITHNCVYSWRGANLKNILNFEKDYKNTKIVFLEENYRSTQNILEVANTIIRKNQFRPEKNLFTKNKEGEKISLYEAMDEIDEADFIATKILELIDTDALSKREINSKISSLEPSGKANLAEIAILYRTNFQSRAIEEAMLRYNIPYQVLGVKFFERREIKDTLAYLRTALNRESMSDIKRIINFPKRGIGKVTLLKIFANETEDLPIKMKIKIAHFYDLLDEIALKIKTEKPSEVIKFVIKKTGIENELKNGGEDDAERLENIKELVTLSLKYDNLTEGKGIEKLLEDASLQSDQDSLITNKEKKENVNAVKLMTVHSSKGLEFDYVFITGLEDGLFPNERDGETKSMEDKEEERRLFYVALTRAKEKLFLSFANYRTIFGSRTINTPSSFIKDIPGYLIETEGEKIKTIYL